MAYDCYAFLPLFTDELIKQCTDPAIMLYISFT